MRGGTRKSAARAPRAAARAPARAESPDGERKSIHTEHTRGCESALRAPLSLRLAGCAGSPLQLHTRSIEGIESYLSTQT